MTKMIKQTSAKKASGSLAAVVMALALSGCAGVFNGAEQAMYSPRVTHPITVERETTSLNIDVARGQIAMSPSDRAQVEAFAQRYRAKGHGMVTIATPSGAPNSGAAASIVSDIRIALMDAGIPKDAINYTPYEAPSAQVNAPVLVSYARYVAKASPCGDWSDSYSQMPDNTAPANFGCATQSNLAAMVADPADLLGQRPMDKADAERRSTVLDKYRKGEMTATKREDQDSGAVSKVEK